MAGMAKLADAADLKSAGPKGLWGFDSPSRHQIAGARQSGFHSTRRGRDALRTSGRMPALRVGGYHTRHTLAAGFTMGWPGLHEKASANSGMFTTTPLMR